jgi:acyl carrier protein
MTMSAENRRALCSVFAQTLGLSEDQIVDALSYNQIPQWDSVAHMFLIAALEEKFGVTLDPSDIVDLTSVAKAQEILTNQGVSFGAEK